MDALPCIEIQQTGSRKSVFDENQYNALVQMLVIAFEYNSKNSDNSFQQIIRMLVSEGKHFRNTPKGEEWLRTLENSDYVNNGLVFWHSLDMDRSLSYSDPEYDSPSEMLKDIFEKVGHPDWVKTLNVVSQMIMERWAIEQI